MQCGPPPVALVRCSELRGLPDKAGFRSQVDPILAYIYPLYHEMTSFVDLVSLPV